MKTKSYYGLDLLAWSPHPDDAEIFCGGLLLTMSDAGYSTGIVDLSRGELGSQGSVELRAEEVKNASLVLGLKLRENLSLPDGGLNSEEDDRSKGSQLGKVVAALRNLRPETVLIPYWEGRHPDHVAASKLMTKAIFFANLKHFHSSPNSEPFRPRQVVYYQMRFAFNPSFIADISSVAQRKLDAIRCFKSQIKREPENVDTLISSPLSLDSIDARDRYYGAMIGCLHGEPYLITQAMRVDNPLLHFQINPVNNALLFPEKK